MHAAISSRIEADETSTRIDDLIDCPTWRREYPENGKVVHFLLDRFDRAMQRVGYLSAADDAHMVKISGMGVMLYVLAFYSKHPTGKVFWQQTRASLSAQLGFGL